MSDGGTDLPLDDHHGLNDPRMRGAPQSEHPVGPFSRAVNLLLRRERRSCPHPNFLGQINLGGRVEVF